MKAMCVPPSEVGVGALVGLKVYILRCDCGQVTPWTAYFYSNFIVSPVVPVALRPDFQPYYKAACANYPSST